MAKCGMKKNVKTLVLIKNDEIPSAYENENNHQQGLK